jgi:PadR family transcriptional regulator, regulatory protein PadR
LLFIYRLINVERIRRPSPQTAAVFRALAEEPTAWRYGYELCRQLGIKAGSMYPILMRLADRGVLETTWEISAEPGRPPRHLYRLTGPGLSLAAELAETTTTTARPTAARSIPRAPRLAEGRR